MVDEDQPQREAAKQIEPQFTLAAHGKDNGGRGGYGWPRGLPLGRFRLAPKGRCNGLVGNERHLAPFLAG